MTNEELKDKITGLTPGVEYNMGKQYMEFLVPPSGLVDFCQKLKNDPMLGFDYMINLTAVDNNTHFTVVCHLESTVNKYFIIVKTKAEGRENPEVPSLSAVWATAEFFEREVFDMFGVKFTNHPDLRRLFLDENWIGYPLRKDYKDDKIIER